MVNQPDKKDLVINGLVRQRDQAMNYVVELEAQIEILSATVASYKARIEELEPK